MVLNLCSLLTILFALEHYQVVIGNVPVVIRNCGVVVENVLCCAGTIREL